MGLKIKKVSVPFTMNFIIAFFILLFLLMQLHQLLHHVAGGILCGKVGYLTFDKHHYSEGLSEQAFKIATLIGPIFSHYLAMWIGLFLLVKNRYQLLGLSFVFASLPVGRFAAINGGDEKYYGEWICQLFGFDISYATIISVVFTSLILVPPLIAGFMSIANKQRLILFLSLLIVPALFYFLFIFYPDHRFVVPQVIESYETGKPSGLALQLFWGLPLIDIIITIILSVLFFGKYYRYLLIENRT
jgi:hypothetical protein